MKMGTGVAVLALVWACWAGLVAEEPAQEVLNNAGLKSMVESGISFPVIKAYIDAHPCRFTCRPEEMVEIRQRAVKGGMPSADVDSLLHLFMEKARADTQRLKDMADRFMNIAVNEDRQEYESMVRTMLREGVSLVPHLLKHIEEENELKRVAVLDALGRIGDRSDAVVRSAKLMLDDRSAPVRAAAANAVARLGDAKTTDELIDSVQRRRGQYLDGTVMALGYLREPKAVPALTDVLDRATDRDARLAAAFAIGLIQVKDKAAKEALLRAVLDESDHRLRMAAAKALGQMGEPETAEYIIRACQRFQTQIGREDLIRQLQYFKALDVLDFLIKSLEDDSPVVQRAARETLKILTGANAETIEDWRSTREIIAERPEWRPARKTAGAPK